MDHWKFLAEELGAEVPAEDQGIAPDTESADVVPDTTPLSSEAGVTEEPPPPPVSKAPVPPRPAPARRTTSDWSRLAEELGIEVPPEPEPEPPPPEETLAVVPEEPDVSWREPAPVRQPEPRPERRREEPRRPAADASRDEDRGRRRRRRRRRPFEGGERESAGAGGPSSEPAAAEEEIDVPFGDADLDFGESEPGEVVGREGVGDDAELLAPPTAASSPSKRSDEGGRVRGKRRRRRKGPSSRRESPAVGEETDVYEGSDAGTATPGAPPADRKEPEPLDDDFDAADEDLIADEDVESESRSDKSLHRAIPSWFEAVNVVVSANLESRAKNPDRKSTGRSRGGHDRRGRDRGGERPK